MRRASLLLSLVLITGFAWLGSNSDQLASAYTLRGQNHEYYSLLVHGFLKGHLYMDAPVDPRFLSSDPEVHRSGTYLLDASLYKGRYYLYYGVVPAVFIYLPYRLLTGSDLSGNAVTVFCVVLGFLVYLRIFSEAKKRYFPGITAVQEFATVAFLALGPGTPALVVVGGVYETAIAAGYLCHALTWLCLFRAWTSGAKAGRWLALGSLMAGLAVGCRPHYILMLPVVAALALLLAGRGHNRRALALAAITPALVVGLLLGTYNLLRFDTPFEFGIHHVVDDMIGSGYPLYSASFFWSNLEWYYLRPPAFGIYFPYVFPMNASDRPAHYYGFETLQGQLVVLLAAALTAGAFVAQRRRKSDLKVVVGLSALAFGLIYLGLAFLGARSDRYIVDFQGSLVLAIALAAGFCWAGSGDSNARSLRLGLAGFVVLASAAALSNLFASFQLANRLENSRPRTWAVLTKYGNLPSALMDRLGLITFGPVRVHFSLPPFDGRPYSRPLIATGLPNTTDTLYVTQYSGNRVELAVSHSGYGSQKSPLITLDPAREHELEADLGSLYPPRGHLWFGSRSEEEVEMLKTSATVKVDGAVVIHARMRFYDAPPNWISFGSNPGGNDSPFTGTVTKVGRLPAASPGNIREQSVESGVWRINLEFPFQVPGIGQPILGSGISNRGNLLYVETHRDHTIRFVIDEWGRGLLNSSDIPVASEGNHLLEVFVGGQVARAKLPAGWGLDPAALKALSPVVRVWLDGRLVWSTEIAVNQDTYNFVSIGSNPQGFSSTPSNYLGPLQLIASSPEDVRRFIERNLPRDLGRSSAVRFHVVFPPLDPEGPGVPLLGMGIAGHGNLVLLKALDARRACVEMDDWAHGVQSSRPLDLGPGEHDMVILLGPLTDGDSRARRVLSEAILARVGRRVLVFLDGALVGDFEATHYVEHMSELTPGANPQGFSTAGGRFPGPLFEPDLVRDADLRELAAKVP